MISELVEEYWEEVGVKTSINPVDRAYLITCFAGGTYMVNPWAFDSSAECAIAAGMNPYIKGWPWAPQWQTWWDTKGEKGEEPPEEVKRMFSLADEIPFLSEEERNKALKEIFDTWAENVWRIGTVGMVPKPAVTNINLGNVNTDTYTDNASVGCGTFNRIYQFFWKK